MLQRVHFSRCIALIVLASGVFFAAAAAAGNAPPMGSPGWTQATPLRSAPAASGSAVLTPSSCAGSVVVLAPPIAPTNGGIDFATLERSVFVTAIKDFIVCSVGFKLQVSGLPQTLNARIYAANGTTRGALLASGSVSMSETGNVMHFVPLSCTLQECRDYEIAFDVPGGDYWDWWNENVITEPFDAAAVIRVRNAALSGDITNIALPQLQLVGAAVRAPTTISDFAGTGATTSASDDFEERGLYVHMLATTQLSFFGFEADLAAGQTVSAFVFSATGTTRGALLATASYTVLFPGLTWHDIPIDWQLLEGSDYNICVSYGNTNTWSWWDENTMTEPFSVGPFSIVDAERNGQASNFALPHFRARWEPVTGGGVFDLRKITDTITPPNLSNQPNSSYGIYVTSVITQQLYSVGWEADVPAGQPITATIYAAAGTARGALISSGTITSSAGGKRFHDIPLAAQLVAGTDYDISITWLGVTQWGWWWDSPGMPYTINGVLQMRDGEFNGNAGNGAVVHIRARMCNNTLTPVADGPLRTPMFMATPAPNPITGVSRVDFSIDEAGPVSIHVYDAAGRRVSTVLEGNRPRGWNSADLDSQHLASGVYFLKMQTRAGSLTRKFVVVH